MSVLSLSSLTNTVLFGCFWFTIS
uniref:Uncharacterized protein n=1 Tax=Anguilla anguilla TaxID=7936 RepID=A0A0E9S7D5_ANGAN